MPNKRASWRAVAWGALVAALLFELSKRLFSLFILNFNNYEVIYGALATIPIFLIWIYLSWLVTLFGAEIIASLDEEPQLLDEEPEPLNEEPQPKEGLSLLKKGSERLLKVFQR